MIAALPIEGLSIPVPKPQHFPGASVLEHAEDIVAAAAETVAGLAEVPGAAKGA
jgi:hypothetical protein